MRFLSAFAASSSRGTGRRGYPGTGSSTHSTHSGGLSHRADAVEQGVGSDGPLQEFARRFAASGVRVRPSRPPLRVSVSFFGPFSRYPRKPFPGRRTAPPPSIPHKREFSRPGLDSTPRPRRAWPRAGGPRGGDHQTSGVTRGSGWPERRFEPTSRRRFRGYRLGISPRCSRFCVSRAPATIPGPPRGRRAHPPVHDRGCQRPSPHPAATVGRCRRGAADPAG